MPVLKVWLLVITVVLVLSLLPDSMSPGFPARGWGHIPAYALLTAVSVEVCRDRFGRRGVITLGAALSVMLFGIAVEFIQPLVGRSFSGVDMVRNGLGVLIGLACLPWLRRVTHREWA